jgi:acetoacetyl-CoA synthetase
MESEILWQPGSERIAGSNMARFAAAAGIDPADPERLHAWSIAEAEAFYSLLWDYLCIKGEKGGRATLPAESIRDVRFFPDAKINYAENLLAEPDERLAIVAHRDDGIRRVLTRRELHAFVSKIVLALRAEGISQGDRIAAIVTNDLEAVAFYLASAAVGAIWGSCSPDFGAEGASDRLNQIEPAILVAAPSYSYAGKQIDTTASINAVAAAPSVSRIVLLGAARGPYVKDAVTLDDWLAPFEPGPIAFLRQRFDAPMVILFSSGTTGKPKCILHSGGGLLLQHRKEQVLHCDLMAGDRFFYYTTCGWMMWNWLITGLASGATIVTYDGNPSYPNMNRMLDLIDAEVIAIFGTSAKFIDSCQKAGMLPARTHSLASLRAILSTGSPLLPQNFDHIYADWKRDVHLASISGGTDICGCFLGGDPTRPVRRGELQGPMLGMDVSVFDPVGRPMAGAPGELVCRNAHLSMPVGFWQDDEGLRYRAAYFERYPGVWTHGDFVEFRSSGGYLIHGRSDTVLNPGGVRIGTAEIYRQVETLAEVMEAVAVGQTWKGDQRIVLFVRLRSGVTLDEKLEKAIRARIRTGATPRHVPARIVAVAEIPRTRSGKISEIAVRDTIHGRTIGNDAALENPECLAAFRNLPQLAD